MSFSPLRSVERFLASVKLTIVLLALIGIASIVGTLIPQANSVGGSPLDLYRFYVNRYGPRTHVIFNTLSLYDLYYSWWFSALLALLAINMIVCSLSRFRWRWRMLGFQVTHLSIVFLLAGILIGLNGQQGYVRIFEGGQADSIVASEREPLADTPEQAERIAATLGTTADEAQIPLGFEIHLQDFELRRKTQPTDSLLVRSALGGGIRTYNLAFQKQVSRAAGEPWDIKILEVKPVLRRTQQVVESTTGPLNPALEFEFVVGDHRHTDWLLSEGLRQKRQIGPDAEIEYRRFATRAKMEPLLAEKTLAITAASDLIQVARGQSEPTTFPVRIGETHRVPGTSVTLTPLRFVPHFQMDLETRQVISASAERRNPAVQVRIQVDGTSETQWLFSRNPAFHGGSKLLGPSISLRFVERQGTPVNYLRVLSADDSPARVLQRFLNGQLIASFPAEPGRSLVLPDGIEVVLTRWLQRAVVESAEQEEPDRFSARVRLRNRLTGKTQEMEIPSGEVMRQGRLSFVLEREYPIDQFISHVTVTEGGREVLEKDIEMNAPLKYRGYTFYQSSYDAKAGAASRYTVLSVSRDPGIWLVYLSFGTLTLGLVIVFYINPLLTGRGKAATVEGESQ